MKNVQRTRILVLLMAFIAENVWKSVMSYSVLCFQPLYHQLYHRMWLSLLLFSEIHVSTTSHANRKTYPHNLGHLTLSLSKHQPMVSLRHRVAEGRRRQTQMFLQHPHAVLKSFEIADLWSFPRRNLNKEFAVKLLTQGQVNVAVLFLLLPFCLISLTSQTTILSRTILRICRNHHTRQTDIIQHYLVSY